VNPGLPEPAVSVVIPVYNQAHYLAAAIESVLAQTVSAFEILVVDDGSTDNAETVVTRYPGVRYLRQENLGCAAARNRGMRESRGDILVFLDADDRLLPGGLEKGLAAFRAHPDCALVFGRATKIASDGSPLPVTQPPYDEKSDDYAAFLTGCPIWHPAAVLCRRSVFEDGLAFDTSLIRSSDYRFYLEVARRWPVFGHNEIVSEYRQHESARSANSASMLRGALNILQSQRPFVEGDPERLAAWRQGFANYRHTYYLPAAARTLRGLMYGPGRKQAVRDAAMIVGLLPAAFAQLVTRRLSRGIRKLAQRGETTRGEPRNEKSKTPPSPPA
jgi:glycosyltransferase involved in cell wall biosynthesis